MYRSSFLFLLTFLLPNCGPLWQNWRSKHTMPSQSKDNRNVAKELDRTELSIKRAQCELEEDRKLYEGRPRGGTSYTSSSDKALFDRISKPAEENNQLKKYLKPKRE